MVFWRWFCDYYFQTTWFKSYTIETNKEDKKTIKEDKYPSSGIAHSEMGDSYMTMRDMADVCDIKDLKYFRESYITPALEEGLIERLYPNQPKHPKQQYRLTEAAKEWLTGKNQ